MQNQELNKFEFLLTLDGNIIIQRYFNVRDFNPAAKNSVEIYESVKNICEMISSDLKNKTLEFMDENRHLFFDIEDRQDEIPSKESHYLLEIKDNDDIFIQRIFSANVFHPKVRYSVDIRPKIRSMLSDLTDILSSKSTQLEFFSIKK